MSENGRRTHYETLQVHPAAPFDLVTAAYWRLTGEASQNGAGGDVGQRRHELTEAYVALSEPKRRDAYDAEIGLPPREPAPRAQRRRPFGLNLLPGVARADPDYYEIIRVQPDALPGIIGDAYAAMRAQYLRLVRAGRAPVDLLDVLEEAYDVTSDAARRKAYDARRRVSADGGSTNGTVAAAPTKPHPAPTPPEPPAEKPVATTAGTETPLYEKVEPATPKPKADWRLRERAASAARGVKVAARTLIWAGRAAFMTTVLIPRLLFAFGQFFVALALALSAAPEDARPARPAVRRVWPEREWPEEEETVVARIAASASRDGSVSGQRGGEMHASVVVLDGPEQGARFEVSRWPISIGADGHCDIVLPEMAPEQLRLLMRDGRSILYSLSESPAVLVNGEPVAWSPLTAEDTVQVGPHTLKIEGLSRETATS